MPSHSRDRSPVDRHRDADGHGDRHRSSRSKRRRSASPGGHDSDGSPGPSAPPPAVHPKLAQRGLKPLTDSDYFAFAHEFRTWLLASRKKYLDELKSSDARRYFSKFVDKYNAGELSDEYYSGDMRSAASTSAAHTKHKWAFASGSRITAAERATLESVRDTVDTMTNKTSRGAEEARRLDRLASKGKRMRERDGEDERPHATGANAGAQDSGWGASGRASRASPPRATGRGGLSHADRQLEAELEREREQRAAQSSRQRARREEREELDELAPRATGRDALHERRREKAAAHRDFANRRADDDGLDVREDVLLGGADDDGFASALAARDRARDRRGPGGSSGGTHGGNPGADRRGPSRFAEERAHQMNEKRETFRKKEEDTMAMFKALAAQRFGSGAGGSAGA